MRSPHRSTDAPGEPSRGPLYAVRYVDTGGRSATQLYRRRAAAERLAHRVEERGGRAVIFATELLHWRGVA